ncbi:MAG: tRNA uracil 4-sulfurtransferase ThiI [Christensenellales bacterium]
MEDVLIIRYAEIHLKGLNRPFFEKSLVRNAQKALFGIEGAVVRRGESRVYAENISPDRQAEAIDALSRVFGIHSISPAVRLERNFDAAVDVLVNLVKEERDKLSGETVMFKVKARRADKRFPLTSVQMAEKAGAAILSRVGGLKVNLSRPELTAYIEMREHAYCYTRVIEGPGGMPVGCNGRAMLLLSGGIDSPAAGCMIAKRGVSLSAVHFESFPYTSEKALEKVREIARLMARYTGRIRLHVIRFTDIQTILRQKCPHDYITVLMRRFMVRISERIARQDDCLALVTGESVGQVASQTLESIAATDDIANMPVLRPLIGMDKIEITRLARHYGTFETSILPYEDCCTVFVPKHPVTKPRLDDIKRTERGLDIESMINDAIANDLITSINADG